MTFAWTPDLAVGVPSIDAQHQELFRRAQCLLLALADRAGEREVLHTLGFLGDYVATHFEKEERLMRARGYPELALHAYEHRRFAESFDLLRRRFASLGVDGQYLRDVEREVCEWLTHHLDFTDRALGSWLQAHGAP